VWEGPELYICSRIWFDEKWRRCSIPFSRVLQSFCTSGYVIWTWWTAERKYGIDVLLGRGSSRVRPGQLPSLSRVRRILTWSSTSAWKEGHVYVGLLGLFEVIYEDLASLRWDEMRVTSRTMNMTSTCQSLDITPFSTALELNKYLEFPSNALTLRQYWGDSTGISF